MYKRLLLLTASLLLSCSNEGERQPLQNIRAVQTTESRTIETQHSGQDKNQIKRDYLLRLLFYPPHNKEEVSLDKLFRPPYPKSDEIPDLDDLFRPY